jgi:hypothetical protein
MLASMSAVTTDDDGDRELPADTLMVWLPAPLWEEEVAEEYCGKLKKAAKGLHDLLLLLCSCRFLCTSRDWSSCSSSLT